MLGENPFGVNLTRRYVSGGGEEQLYREHIVDNHGRVELVDYMGGDEVVERVATAGHTRRIFPERVSQEAFIDHLAKSGIVDPFKFVQLKLSFQAPIETALAFVYDSSANVNEYSGRYSQMIDSSIVPDLEAIKGDLSYESNHQASSEELNERAKKIRDIFIENRERAYGNYTELVDPELDMARELARAGLGIDNDTRFFWKTDLHSLARFVRDWRKGDESRVQEYIGKVADIAKSVAPLSWNALLYDDVRYSLLTMPNDDSIVDPSLSPPSWKPQETRRVVVPALEEKLFEIQTFLDHGEFQATDYMGDDSAFAQAARTSYGVGTKQLQDDQHLIRSLIRDLHTTPIEMAELAFETKAPVFTDPRQLGRHRTLDNHGFMGYVPIGSQNYFPEDSEFKHQDRLNRQGRGKEMDEVDRSKSKPLIANTYNSELEAASKLRELGAPEWLVRQSKGVGFYTKRSRTGDSHNIGRCLTLRLDAHAQMEVREVAKKIDEAHRLHTPTANEALHTYQINGMRLSEKDVELMIKNGIISSDFDPEDLRNYRGMGWVLEKGTELGREGQSAQKNFRRLLGREQ